jgi:hypothetical protein
MAPRKELSLNERARLLAIQSIKERARGKTNPQEAKTPSTDVRSTLLKKEPGIAMSDAAAKLFAEAIRGMLKGE